MKEKPASLSSQQSKSTPTVRPDNPSRMCTMSKEVEKHVNDMHAKAGLLATPSLRNIKVRVTVMMRGY